MMVEDLTLTDDAVLKEPFAAYKWLRDHAPVYEDPVTGHFIISRFDDVEAAAADFATFSSSAQMQVDQSYRIDDEGGRILREQAVPHVDTLQSADPPAHTKYRALVQGAFHPRRIREMDAYMNGICVELIEKFAGKGRCEVQSELAIPLPMYIIADQLGVPRDNYETFKWWSDSRLMLTNPRLPADLRVTPDTAVALPQLGALRGSLPRRLQLSGGAWTREQEVG